jgi:two-component system, chemotaxis family, protein-glutamate methylesterase/glutaminase
MPRRLRAIVVEDSLTQRVHLARLLEAEGDIAVVAEAKDVGEAVAKVARHRPDVVTMDLDLPGGGGQAAIERIMAESPVPILVLSGIIEGAAAVPAIRALAAGAVDAVPKPTTWTDAAARDLRRQLRTVSSVPVVSRRAGVRRRRAAVVPGSPGPVVAIAASTGGPAALTAVLAGMPALSAPVLIVQHIHPSFVDGFVAWLDEAGPMPVRLARSGALAEPGVVHVAPGDVHLRLESRGRLRLDPEPPGLHRPSADELLRSVAEWAGAGAVGVVLTGMGDDGAQGLLAIREAGGRTFAQSRESCTVFGMPRAAERLGAVEEMLPPDRIGEAIAHAVGEARPVG